MSTFVVNYLGFLVIAVIDNELVNTIRWMVLLLLFRMTRIKTERIRDLPTAKIAICRNVLKIQERVHHMIILNVKRRSVLSLGPSVVEIFLQPIPIRYRCDEVDADVGIGYPIATVVDVSISIESLFHRLMQNLNPMVKTLPMLADNSRCNRH
jgi:hypothetical protein